MVNSKNARVLRRASRFRFKLVKTIFLSNKSTNYTLPDQKRGKKEIRERSFRMGEKRRGEERRGR
jgi:hypothetical protein